MLIDRNSKSEFVLNCFRELLDDGEPHRYREIIDYVREQAKGTQYEGTIEQNNLVLPISKKLEDPAFPYARVSHGIYHKTEQSPVQQESVGCHTPSAYDLLDILFVVQRQMEVIHKTQQEEFPSSKTLEQSFQVVSGHLETLLDSMSMWIADMEDLTQEPPQEHKNEALTGMQMG